MKKNLLLIVIIILFSSIQVFGMDFQVSKLITISGDNTNFDLLIKGDYRLDASHICWENQNDSLYTIYLKKIENKSAKETKMKMHLYHYQDGEKPDCKKDDFLGWCKKGQSFNI